MSHIIGVCSWSLRPESPAMLVQRVLECGLSAVQLALDPIRIGQWPPDDTRPVLADAGIEIVSGMMATFGEDYTSIDSIRRTGGLRPDQHWEANLAAARANADISRKLGIDLVTLHAGFIPEAADDPLRATMIARIAQVAHVFGDAGVRIGLETGQESASALRQVLEAPSMRSVGVNFDPANMLLYGSGDPIAALELLGDRVVQAHMKDAVPSGLLDAWGTEVPAGAGHVDWDAYFRMLAPGVPVIIEREAGDHRIEDVKTAAKIARRHASAE